jgi:hypothetical protein
MERKKNIFCKLVAGGVKRGRGEGRGRRIKKGVERGGYKEGVYYKEKFLIYVSGPEKRIM